MKVRHKRYGPLGEAIQAGDYYILLESNATQYIQDAKYAVPVEKCEVVREDQWKDVTNELDWGKPGSVYHKGTRLADLMCGGQYRVRQTASFGKTTLTVEQRQTE